MVKPETRWELKTRPSFEIAYVADVSKSARKGAKLRASAKN